MKLMRGNMLDALPSSHLFVISTNGVLKSGGLLVMGKGIAGQVSEKYPAIAKIAGVAILSGNFKSNEIKDYNKQAQVYSYGFLKLPDTNVCLFQTKGAWWRVASMYNIEMSLIGLKAEIDKLKKQYGADPIVNMNFPGIGYGQLPRPVVLSAISKLPDCVNVWEYEESNHAEI